MNGDLTKRSEVELTSRVLEVTPDHVSIVGADYRYRFVNQAYERAHGRPASVIVGTHVSDVLGRDAFERLARPKLDGCLAGQEVSYEAWFEFDRHGRRYMSVRYLPLTLADPQAPGVLVLAHDMTEHKLAQEALRDSEERYRAYITHAPHGIFVVDGRGRYLEVNRAAREMTGYTEDELLARSIDQLVPEDSKAQTLEAFQRLLAEGFLEQRIALRRKDGSQLWVNLSATRVAPDRYLGFCDDITEEMAVEEQLRHAQKMEALGVLAGGVAHDFNNILTAIMGYATMILMRADVEPLRGELQEVLTAANRASELTRQLLTFSRRDASPAGIVNVNEVVTGLQPMLTRVIGEHITFVTKLDPTGPRVAGERSRVEQVLMNLVVNARDAMPAGGRLEISTSTMEVSSEVASQRQLPRGRVAVLEVADEGCGMTAEVKDRIFDPFFTTKQPGSGSGLGLSTAYGIVRGLKGSMEVDSQIGEGTRFRVFLPCAEGDAKEVPKEPSSLVQGRGTVLVVEDELALRKLVANVLSRAGYEVRVAARPSEALRALENGSTVDLMLTDVVMPEMSGAKLAKACHQLRPGLPVLFMSGYPGRAQGGFDDPGGDHPLLEKPFSPAQLTQAIERALRAASSAPP